MKTYYFKLYRSKKNKKLHRLIDIAGQIYNHLIALHKRYYRLYGKHLSVNKLMKHITSFEENQTILFLEPTGFSSNSGYCTKN